MTDEADVTDEIECATNEDFGRLLLERSEVNVINDEQKKLRSDPELASRPQSGDVGAALEGASEEMSQQELSPIEGHSVETHSTEAIGAVDQQAEQGLDQGPSASLQVEPSPTEGSPTEDKSTEHKPTEHKPMGAQQQELPFAIVAGKPITEMPKDLYIPPAALQVFLEAFEGPLDLLLYLIKRQNIDILDINVSEITVQYIQYVELMDAMQFELAAEYLVMAAMLAEIKSRLLLPRCEELEDEEDPRARLIRRLQEYERFKRAAEEIEEMPRMGRDIYQGSANPPLLEAERPLPELDLKELLLALGDVMRRADMYESHHVQKEKLSTRERMSKILADLRSGQFVLFTQLFSTSEGRLGVVVTFLAIMELIKETLIEIVQTEPYGPIHVKAKAA